MNKLALLAAAVLLGFASTGVAKELLMQNPVPYAANSAIASKVKNECPLGTQLAQFVKEFAGSSGYAVQFTDSAPSTAKGYVLKLEITDAMSGGNAFIGHYKSTTVSGVLYEDGKKKAEVMARRQSSGGFGAGFKGSCSVLGRTVKAIGMDLGTWLSNPVDGARLGDL